MIPGPKVGLIIGKGGETIKQLQVRKSINSHLEYFNIMVCVL
jgi:ribosomal protein S3